MLCPPLGAARIALIAALALSPAFLVGCARGGASPAGSSGVELGQEASASPARPCQPGAEPTPARAADPSARGPVFVEWRGAFWPSSVLATLPDGRPVVRYDGYGPEWDEVVTRERVRRELPPGERDAPIRGESRVFVAWKGAYWPAIVRRVASPDLFEIRYEGYGAEWDETVGPDRIKRLDPDGPVSRAAPSGVRGAAREPGLERKVEPPAPRGGGPAAPNH